MVVMVVVSPTMPEANTAATAAPEAARPRVRARAECSAHREVAEVASTRRRREEETMVPGEAWAGGRGHGASPPATPG